MHSILGTVTIVLLAAAASAATVARGYTLEQYASITNPAGLSFDPASGNLFVGTENGAAGDDDTAFGFVRRVTPTGTVTNFSQFPIVDPDAVQYVSSGPLAGSVLVGSRNSETTGSVSRITSAGTVSFLASPTELIRNPTDWVVDSAGRIFFSDGITGQMRNVQPDGNTTATFRLGIGATGLALRDETIYAGTIDGRLFSYPLTTFGPLVPEPDLGVLTSLTIADDPLWQRDLIALRGDDLIRVRLDGPNAFDVTVIGTGFAAGRDLVWGPDGALYVSDTASDVIWRITPEPSSLLLLGMLLLLRRSA